MAAMKAMKANILAQKTGVGYARERRQSQVITRQKTSYGAKSTSAVWGSRVNGDQQLVKLWWTIFSQK